MGQTVRLKVTIRAYLLMNFGFFYFIFFVSFISTFSHLFFFIKEKRKRKKKGESLLDK